MNNLKKKLNEFDIFCLKTHKQVSLMPTIIYVIFVFENSRLETV